MARPRRSTVERWRRALEGSLATARSRVRELREKPADRIALDQVRRRLEILVTALHGRAMHIEAIAAPRPSLTDRIARVFTPHHLRPALVPAADGETIRLPEVLELAPDDPAALPTYRLLALEQAERIARGTAAVLAQGLTPLERDLYLLREGMIVDARLALGVRGLAGPVDEARRAALAARPPLDDMTDAERQVELLTRAALADETALRDQELARTTPAESLAWARAQARSFARTHPYRGVAPLAHWGIVRAPGAGMGDGAGGHDANPYAARTGTVQIESRNAAPDGTGGESDRPNPDGGSGRIADTRGAMSEDGAADPAGGASHDHANAPAQGEAAAALHPDDAVSRPRALDDEPVDPTPGTLYPEWSYTEGRYIQRAVAVRERAGAGEDDAWAREVLRRHAPLVRRIRERFEPLRAQRTRLGQQRDGTELDVPACVQALVDARTGHTPGDRLYLDVRPARRGMAICLLVDVSGSTEAPVASGQRIIDVEKVAVLLASAAFDALGDAYAVMTFSSRGARDVRVTTIKDFAEANGAAVHRRIAAMEPSGNTRLGAAVRHATARLARAGGGHRLLLILSDGRPNDVDHYHERFGAEDARQAIHEARAAGIYPFCLTIDQESGPEYLARVFGATGHTLLTHPEQLPMALVSVVRGLLAR